LGERVHFWPFDGWDIPVGRSAIAEVYPRLWSRGLARTGDQHDAYSIAAWLRRADHDGGLAAWRGFNWIVRRTSSSENTPAKYAAMPGYTTPNKTANRKMKMPFLNTSSGLAPALNHVSEWVDLPDSVSGPKREGVWSLIFWVCIRASDGQGYKAA
jgi:hypothetical protein